ncbi:MAG: long-chain fatty acid--CoA ligase [Bacilli bacterium]|nr:long-chain fatty acid--CoA ligase [Bacilli bacterium]
MTLFQKTFLERVNKQGKNPMLDDDRVGEYSIEEAYNLTCVAAKRLFDFGFRPGEAVIIKATRSASTVILFYAFQFLGVITVLTDYRQNEKDVYKIDPRIKGCAYQKDESGDIFSWTIEKEGRNTIINVPEKEDADHLFPGVERKDNSDAVWVFTSGSEGTFKVVRHSQETLFSHCSRYAAPSSCDETDRGIVLLPLYHVFGLALIYFPVLVGFAICFPSSLELDDIIDYAIRKKITYLDTVPSFHYALAKRIKERNVTIPSLRNGLTGGAPMEESRFREIEETLGMNLLPVYGASEIITIAALGQEASKERRRTTVGQLIPDTELRLLDENGEEVKLGEPGEIVVRSPSLMLGYLGEDSGIDKDGFFATGDIGYLDENKDLHISGRKKQIIIRNGNNLSIAEIENLLLEVEGILSCCVVGVPSPSSGETVAAMVSLKEGTEKETTIRKVKEKLPKIMWVEHMEFVSSLPLLPSGKVDRMKIKNFLQGKYANR